MQTTTTTEAAWDTITLAAAKRHLRIYTGDHDVELTDEIIPAAIDWCEAKSGRTLRTDVARRTTLACWDELGTSLPAQPVIDIEELTYIDENGDEQTVSADDYRLNRSTDAAAVLELDGEFDFPTVAARSDAIRLDYTTGYATVAAVPPRAKQAIKTALNLFWGDLAADEVEKWERAAERLLGLVEWGSYR